MTVDPLQRTIISNVYKDGRVFQQLLQNALQNIPNMGKLC